MEEREKDIEKLEKQIKRMTGQSNAKVEEKQDRYRSRTEQRRKEREDKQKKRKDARRGRKKETEMDFQIVQVDAKEQIFLDEVKANREVEDDMLDEISKGLDELKNLGSDINKTLAYQGELLKQVDAQLEDVTEKFDSGNQKLQKLLDSQGGPSRWIPRICCFIILLAIVGYILKIVFGI